MSSSTKLNIDLRQMILAIETSVDLVGMNDTNHGKRVGYIAAQIANKLKYKPKDIHFIFELGLIHDCGVSTEQMHNELVNHFDWHEAHIHCTIGYNLLKKFKPLKKFALPILYHHTPYEKLKTIDISQKNKDIANLIFLADRIDVMAAAHYETDILLIKEQIINSITSYKGTYFDPILVDAFLEIEQSEAFWISLQNRHIARYTWDMSQFESKKILSLSEVRQLSLILAYIVDQKSPFTAKHSSRVGCLAKFLASIQNLDEEICKKIEIAGFLHDIGKLRTPDSILEKRGPLNELERSIINQHSYETYEILRQVDGIEDIARWASYHHENINEAGYPFHPAIEDFCLPSRTLAVADVFQALIQDRPYRKGMSLKEALDILDEFVNIGKLDKNVVEITKKHKNECFKIAKGKSKENKKSEQIFKKIKPLRK